MTEIQSGPETGAEFVAAWDADIALLAGECAPSMIDRTALGRGSPAGRRGMSRPVPATLVPLALVIALPVAKAQPAVQSAAQHPDPASLAAAEQLLRDNGEGARTEQAMRTMRTAFVSILKSKTQQPDQVARIVDQVLMPSVRQRIPELEAQIAALYASNASLADLKSLDAFYRSPLGQRAVVIAGAIQAQSLPIAIAFMRRIIPDVLKAEADVLRQKGVSL